VLEVIGKKWSLQCGGFLLRSDSQAFGIVQKKSLSVHIFSKSLENFANSFLAVYLIYKS
jgi:hypothetical protein